MRRMWILAGAAALLAATIAAAAPDHDSALSTSAAPSASTSGAPPAAGDDFFHDHSTHDHPRAAHSAVDGDDAADAARSSDSGRTESTICGPVQELEIEGAGIACYKADYHENTPYKFVDTPSVPAYQPHCYGDGVSRNRVHLIYAYVDGRFDRSQTVVPTIINRYVPYIEGNVRRASAAGGREFGVRFLMPGCQLQVTTVKLPAAALTGGMAFGAQLDVILTSLYDQGFRKADRKYLVWFDGPSLGSGGVCGVALMFPDDVTPLPTNIHNGRPGEVAIPMPGGPAIIAPNYAITYHTAGGTLPCWGRGYDGAHTETHELFHTLGAVQLRAPNSDGGGHCVDAEDIMCYEPGSAPDRIVMSCMTMAKELDCNRDDYFNPNPVIGSYLSTHWNTANNNFLGPDPLDPVTTAVPLPTPLP